MVALGTRAASKLYPEDRLYPPTSEQLRRRLAPLKLVLSRGKTQPRKLTSGQDITAWLKTKAAAGEEIRIPAGGYYVSDEVRFHKMGQVCMGNGPGNGTGGSVSGGSGETTLFWTGPDTKRMFRFGQGSINHRFGGMTLVGPGSSHTGSTAVGMGDFVRPGDSTNGTVTYRNQWERIVFLNWDVCVNIGNSAIGVCGSDSNFDMMDFGGGCNFGMIINTGNGLNFNLHSPSFLGLQKGIVTNGGGNVAITGRGTSSLMSGPILEINNAGEFLIDGLRVENSTSDDGIILSVKGDPEFWVPVTVRDCGVEGEEDLTKFACKITGNTKLRFESNRPLCCSGVRYRGSLASHYGTLTAIDNLVNTTLLDDDPTFPLTGSRLVAWNNSHTDNNGVAVSPYDFPNAQPAL